MSEIKNISMKAEVINERCYAAGVEDAGRDHKPRNTSRQGAVKGREMDLPTDF